MQQIEETKHIRISIRMYKMLVRKANQMSLQENRRVSLNDALEEIMKKEAE